MQQQDVAHTEKAFVAGEEGKANRVKVFWTQFKNGNDQEKPNAFMFNTIILTLSNLHSHDIKGLKTF